MCGFVPRCVPSNSETYLCVSDDFRDIWDIPCFYRKSEFNSELRVESYIIFHICDESGSIFRRRNRILSSEANWTESHLDREPT